MKKKLFISIVLMLAVLLSCNVFAAQSAFERNVVNADTVVIDADADQGRNGAVAGYVEGFGIGNTWIDDVVAFENLDFGANGAKEATIGFAFGQEGAQTELALYVDDIKSEPVAKWTVKYEDTLGWGEADQKDFTQSVTIPAGTHTVYVKWASAESGSLYSIVFTEAPAPETTVAPETAAPAPAEPVADAPVAAPQTSDMGIFVAVCVLALSAGIVVTVKKVSTKR